MKLKLLSFFAAAKTGAARFLRTKGIYVVVMSVVAAAGLAAALLIYPRGADEPIEDDPSGAVGQSQDDTLTLMRTPVPTPSPTPSPTPIPTFTQAPSSAPRTEKPLLSPPVRGEIIWGYAVDQLIYSRTLKQWMTHAGVDVACPKGTEVNAVFGGTVEEVYEDDMLGVCVCISGTNGLTALYGNLAEEPPVKEGEKINAGAVVGNIGDTAVSECGERSHLHFELQKDGASVDPTKYVRFIKES